MYADLHVDMLTYYTDKQLRHQLWIIAPQIDGLLECVDEDAGKDSQRDYACTVDEE